jgi:hypothetical protein
MDQHQEFMQEEEVEDLKIFHLEPEEQVVVELDQVVLMEME